MPNIRLLIEYNGSKFHGWQKQPGVRTIQQTLHETLELVLREKIHHVQASGRTDEGVHARGQVVNFVVSSIPDLGRLKRAVSSILRGELAVHDAAIVADDFNSLRSARAKTYRYTIYNCDVPPVLDQGFVWLVHNNLDIDLMARQAKVLLGKHDFKSFQGSGCEVKDTTKEIFDSVISSDPPYLYYSVTGSGFLKHMVRNIVGTLVEIGRQSHLVPPMAELIKLRNRTKAGPTAPPWGLCLEKVYYDGEFPVATR